MNFNPLEAAPLSAEIRKIRRKLQGERLLKGAAIVLGALLLATLLGSAILARNNFSDQAIFWTRLVAGVLWLGLFLRYFALPALRRPAAGKVARFLEERHPELQDRISTAVEVGEAPSRVHPAIRRLIQRDAAAKLRTVERPRLYHRRVSLFSLAATVFSAVAFFGMLLTGPEAFRYSLGKLAYGAADERPPLYAIHVTPGDAKVVRHADVEIRAVLQGFDSQDVRLRVKYENQPNWEDVAMRPAEDENGFVFLLFDARERIEYYVEADGIRSDRHTITVSEIPAVEKLQVTLKFPRHTGLKQQVLEDEGDIRALTGTVAEFVIETDQAVQGGRIKLEEGGEIELESVGPRQLRGGFTVKTDDFYRVHLRNMEGVWSPASDEYLVTALQDQPPSISFQRPGRDQKVTNLEEVFTELKAEDDFGVRSLRIRYTANGGPEQTVDLEIPRLARSATGSHTFYLEEFDLQPGDFVSYYGEAADAATTAKSDLYFLEVEPYDREYTQSQQSGGGAGGGEDLRLAKFQKEIIAATFNVLRDQETVERKEFEENVQTVALMQQQLQQQAETILDRIERRGAVTDTPMFRQLKAYLKQAISHMGDAHPKLARFEALEALPDEQLAYQQLLRAESLFKEIQLAMGGGGEGGNSSAEDLADLVDLELDKKKNQYETLQQNRQRDRDEALDEATRKLKELARRQQQEVERRRRQASQSSSGGGSSQQELLEEIEELARKLERLSRDRREQKLNEISRQLNQAARDLRQSRNSGNPQEAQMRAQRALERLQQARDALNRQRESEMQGTLGQLARQSRDLAQRQDQVTERVREAENRQKDGRVDESFFKELRDVNREKTALQEDLQSLEADLHQTARRLASKQPETSRRLKEAGNEIRDQRTPEKMQESSELLRRGWTMMARQREESVSEDIQRLAERVEKAESSLGRGNPSDPKEKAEQALGQLGELLENLDSLSRRAGAQQGEQPEDSGRKPGQSPEQSDRNGETGETGREGEDSGREQGSQEASQRQSGDGQQPAPTPGGQMPGQTREGEPVEAGGANAGPPSGTEGAQRTARASMAANSGGINPSQVRREWQERVGDAERIRNLVKGFDPRRARDIAELARRMREIDARRIFDDPEEVARLRSQIIDGFRQLELDLYRNLKKDEEQLRLTHEEEVPPEFRDRVEEYYRALAGARRKP